MFQFFCTFAAAAVLDFVWLRWQAAASDQAPFRTSAWAVAVGSLGLTSLDGALTGPAGVSAYLAGLAVGSGVAVTWSRRRALRTSPDS